jgi:hypothetical protein
MQEMPIIDNQSRVGWILQYRGRTGANRGNITGVSTLATAGKKG